MIALPDTLVGWVGVIGLMVTMLASLKSMATSKRGLEQSQQNTARIQEIHVIINSRLDEFKLEQRKLLETSVLLAHSQGVTEGKSDDIVK